MVEGFGRVLILKGDRFYGDLLKESVRREFPAAVVQVTGCLRDARAFLANSRVDLLVLGAEIADGETLELLTSVSFLAQRFRRVMVVTGRKESPFLARLRSLPLDSVFDPGAEGIAQFANALRALATGRSYWSQSVLERLREPEFFGASVCRRTSRCPARRVALPSGGPTPTATPPGDLDHEQRDALELNEEAVR